MAKISQLALTNNPNGLYVPSSRSGGNYRLDLGKISAPARATSATTSGTITLNPNEYLTLGTLGTVTFALGSIVDPTYPNEYKVRFVADGSTAITWPGGISWASGGAPTISSGTYVLVFQDGIASVISPTQSDVNSSQAIAVFDRMNAIDPLINSKHHYGLSSVCFEFPDGSFGLATRQADLHGIDTDGKIVLYKNDNGLTFSDDPTTILDTSGYDNRDFAFALMDSERIGFMVTTYGHQPIFVYSDNNGSTWTQVAISGFAGTFYCDGAIVRYPSSAGGSDSGGWIVYGYDIADMTELWYIYTTDNGLTWTKGLATDQTSGLEMVEPSICRVGTYNMWLMVVRCISVGYPKAYLSVSTDMTTWSALAPTDFDMGSNPVHLYNDLSSGKIVLIAAARAFTSPLGRFADRLLTISLDPNSIYSADYSEISNDNVKYLGSFYNLLGYFCITGRQDGGYLMSMAYNEKPVRAGSATTSNLIILSDMQQIHDASYRVLTDSNGKAWVYNRIAYDSVEISGFDIQLIYGTSTYMAIDQVFPEALPDFKYCDVQVTTTANNFAVPSGTNIGMLRCNRTSITKTGCNIAATCSLGSFSPGDYIQVSVKLRFYL